MRTKTICITNLKGGVGKTTSTINLGHGLANKGYKVCLMDLDPQSNLTVSVGLKRENPSMYELLVQDFRFEQVIKKISENIFVLPSHFNLIKAESDLVSVVNKEKILEKKMRSCKNNFDFILIDCPPNLGTVTINGIGVSDFIFVPVEAEYLALQGFSFLNYALGNIGAEIDGICVTKYDKRKILNRYIMKALEESFAAKLFQTFVRDNISLAESQSQAMDIFSYDSNSHGAQDYANLTDEILQRWIKE